jgi:glycogen operon protein
MTKKTTHYPGDWGGQVTLDTVRDPNMAKLRPGAPYPLGATWDGLGVHSSKFSEQAVGVELCLFDSPESTVESRRITLTEQTDQVWHVYLDGIDPGQLYGYRIDGPYEPTEGHRFNPAKKEGSE